MALITCTECGKEASDQAKACPHCGATKFKPEAAPKPASRLAWFIGAVVLIGIVMSAANPPPPPPEETPEQKAQNTRINVGATGAAMLKKSAKDPESFSLTSAVVYGNGFTCYEYRAKNSYGAILPGTAVMTDKGKMLVKERDGNTFVSAWNKECTKGGGREIAELIKLAKIL